MGFVLGSASALNLQVKAVRKHARQPQRQIGGWLQSHAGTYKRVNEEPPQDRITRSAWFERKHRKVAPEVWKRASVRSAANCVACHSGADKGDYGDDGVRIPR